MTTAEYIAAQPAELQPVLRKLAETIVAAAPGASERYSYKMPCFYLGKTFLCGFCLFRQHIGFYPGGDTIKAFSGRLSPYRTGAGTVRFPLDEPVDYELITAMVKWKMPS